MNAPKYLIERYQYFFKSNKAQSLYRYICKEELFETLECGVIRLKKPQIWKAKYSDEVYLYDWIQVKKNAEHIFDVAYRGISELVASLTVSMPTKIIQLYWLVANLMRYIDILIVTAPAEHFAICYTQNGFEKNMWSSYAKDSMWVCYETYADYFNKMALSQVVDPHVLMHSSHCDLWKMNYCTPDECAREFVSDLNNTVKIDNAIYLKDVALREEDEVRLSYSTSAGENIRNFKLDYRVAVEEKLKSQQDIDMLKKLFVECIIDYTRAYDDYLQRHKDNIMPILYEDQLYLKLPTKVNEYILSIKTAPDAPERWSDFVRKICRDDGIKYIQGDSRV